MSCLVHLYRPTEYALEKKKQKKKKKRYVLLGSPLLTHRVCLRNKKTKKKKTLCLA